MPQTFDWKMYRYVPSLVGAIIALIIFAILAVLHMWQVMKTKKRVMLWVVIGAMSEVVGYAARIGSHFNNQSWAAFIIQGVFILIGPLLFSATIYMMLGCTIRLAGGEEAAVVSPRWCTVIFVTADISTLIIQGLGSGIMGTMQLKLALAGQNVVIAGLALQVATFCVFVFTAATFHVRINERDHKSPVESTSKDWKKVLWILYSVSILILVRCIFRLIEYTMGNAAYTIAHEWCLYVFDTTLMVLVLVILLLLEPAQYIPELDEKLAASDKEEPGSVG